MSNGWGQLTWSEGLWGQQGDQIIELSGLNATTALGGFTQTNIVEVSGLSSALSLGSITSFTDVSITQTGLSSTLGFGSITFSNTSIESPSGLSQTLSIGTGFSTFADVELTLTGFDITSSLGLSLIHI